jgi:hypothetical protein
MADPLPLLMYRKALPHAAQTSNAGYARRSNTTQRSFARRPDIMEIPTWL